MAEWDIDRRTEGLPEGWEIRLDRHESFPRTWRLFSGATLLAWGIECPEQEPQIVATDRAARQRIERALDEHTAARQARLDAEREAFLEESRERKRQAERAANRAALGREE